MDLKFFYKMHRSRGRVKLFARSSWQNIFLILVAYQQLAFASASSADTTTEYVVLSKSSEQANRFAKSKFLAPSASNVLTTTSRTTTTPGNNYINTSNNRPPLQQQQHTLVALASKSYITEPLTTTGPKLNNRNNVETEKKQKKSFKDQRNRTIAAAASEVQKTKQVPDHVPDSSGHVPYRVGRPILSPPVSSYDGSTGSGSISSGSVGDVSSGGSGNYHSVPYETEKWHNEYWEHDYEKHFNYNTTRVQHIEAECQDDYMKIRVGFNGTFNGLVYSAGYAYDPDCMYINGSGRDYYEFYIQLNRCGTLGKNALHEENRKNPTNFMWNTVTIQYNPLIEEEYDEHFKVTCEYGYDFWKTVTFPFLDVEVATGNPVVFTLSPPECYMEIQNGYGIGGPRVTGPVRVGDPLTLIIYMRSKYDGFDIVVNDCYAHNGANKRIQLIDQFGCPVDDKLISRFRGSWSDSGVFETQVYAYMKTFRFTGSPALYIECDVRMCHGRCPSQPCHWRNLKAVTKRDISNLTSSIPVPPLAESMDVTEKPEASLSENVSLFQSLRVLQEGEADGDEIYSNQPKRSKLNEGHETCIKTTTFSAMTATLSLLLCFLIVALLVSCTRLKQRSKDSIYDTYVTHKGQID